jgi:hypothetical protein
MEHIKEAPFNMRSVYGPNSLNVLFHTAFITVSNHFPVERYQRDTNAMMNFYN